MTESGRIWRLPDIHSTYIIKQVSVFQAPEDDIMSHSKKIRISAVFAASVVVCLAAVYFDNVLDIDAVYTSLFYIPVIMAGLWCYRWVIPLATLFAVFFNVIDIVGKDLYSIDQVFRGLILILGAITLYFLGKTLNQKNHALEISHNLLELEKERMKIMLLSIGDGVISTDCNGIVVFLNSVAKELTGWELDSAIGKPFSEVFDIIHEYTREKPEDPIKKVLATGGVIALESHTTLIAKDGTERYIADSAAPVQDELGNITGVILVFRDVSEDRMKQDKIAYLSFHDQLTGLGNRRFMEVELKRLDRESNMPISIIMGDVNGLKLANDAFGHALGDDLLKKAAEGIQSICRNDDIICRYGGDEFILILPKTSHAEADLITRRLRNAFSDISVGPLAFSMSLGWAVKQNRNDDVMDTIKSAENYMYKRKLMESPSTRGSIIQSIMSTLKGNSEREKCHSERVSSLCGKIAHACNLTDVELEQYKTACMLHDIGKIAIDQRILNKVGKLDEDEWEAIKRHPEIGYRILNAVPDYAEVAEFVLAHHERWDGKGYPKGLKGDDIPYISRIIAILDSYDAMISERPYRKPIDKETALGEILKNAGSQFDPELAVMIVENVLKLQDV